jgi:hypothetical protein
VTRPAHHAATDEVFALPMMADSRRVRTVDISCKTVPLVDPCATAGEKRQRKARAMIVADRILTSEGASLWVRIRPTLLYGSLISRFARNGSKPADPNRTLRLPGSGVDGLVWTPSAPRPSYNFRAGYGGGQQTVSTHARAVVHARPCRGILQLPSCASAAQATCLTLLSEAAQMHTTMST